MGGQGSGGVGREEGDQGRNVKKERVLVGLEGAFSKSTREGVKLTRLEPLGN